MKTILKYAISFVIGFCLSTVYVPFVVKAIDSQKVIVEENERSSALIDFPLATNIYSAIEIDNMFSNVNARIDAVEQRISQ